MSLPIRFIIPCFRGKKTLEKCIDSILSQDYPTHLIQISVIENGPKEGVEELVLNYPNCTYDYSDLQGRSRARNYLLPTIPEAFIAYIDVDVTLEKNWLRSSLKAFESPHIAAVAGPVMRVGSSCTDQYRQFVSEMNTGGTHNTLNNPHGFGTINTAALIIKTDILRKIGGFNEALERSEDMELTHRLLKNGYLIQASRALAYVSWDRGALEYFTIRVIESAASHAQVNHLHGIPFPGWRSFLREVKFSFPKNKVLFGLIWAYIKVLYFLVLKAYQRRNISARYQLLAKTKTRPLLVQDETGISCYFLNPALGVVIMDDHLKLTNYLEFQNYILTQWPANILRELLLTSKFLCADEESKAAVELLAKNRIILLPAGGDEKWRTRQESNL
jgi:glycosyltransferase involved in cell wall biosynthesis